MRRFLVLLFLSAAAPTGLGQASFYEGFDDVGPTNNGQDGPQNLINAGWIFRNQSDPEGAQSWFDGYTIDQWPQPQAGDGYMAVTSSSTDFFGGTVSNWAILPAIPDQQAGDELSFYLLDEGGSNVNTLQVRYSPSGGTGTGSDEDDVGDFTEVLLDINPIPVGGWNLYTVELPGTGRVALRYYIANACNFACFSSYTGLDSLSVGEPPPPPCNLPPVPPVDGTVVWTAADSPYEVCQNLSIPPGGTVIVEPGVVVNFDQDMQLIVSGTLQVDGTAEAPVTFTYPSVFPPMIEVIDGTVEASFAQIQGQFRVDTGAQVTLSDCVFSGNGMIIGWELPAVQPLIVLERCTFTDTDAGLSDALAILRDNTFVNGSASILRGFALFEGVNTFDGAPVFVTREDSIQPMFVDGLHATGNASSAGIWLAGGSYAVGPNIVSENNAYPLYLEGGLVPGSFVPTAGNTNNAIDVGNGGFAGFGTWPNLGLPYRLTGSATSLPGGNLMIEPGVVVEGTDPTTSLIFRSTRRLIAEGLPDAPISFRGWNGQTWGGLGFITNSTEGPRLDFCVIENATFGASSSDNSLYVHNCIFSGNEVGANTNTFGTIHFRKTQFLANETGVSLTDLGSPILNSVTTPNSFVGNVAGIDAFEFGASADAQNVWWGDPTGPDAPGNPGGQGDSVIGPGASGVDVVPFLTAEPDYSDHPPVVRMIEPGITWFTPIQRPDYNLDPGTKYILQWTATDDGSIVAQRIEFSPDGHNDDRFSVLAELSGHVRSYELTVPDAGFAVTNQPQFLRVVAIDDAGQEAFDHTPLIVPSGEITGTLTILTDVSGAIVTGGEPIEDLIPLMEWSGSLGGFPSVLPYLVLETDGEVIAGLNISGEGIFFGNFPHISTDRARLALRAWNNSNRVAWFFADGYFSIRHDPRLGLEPPVVEMQTPVNGASYPGGGIVPITWTASAAEGLRSFDIQASYDAGRTWHPIVQGLPADATSFNWQLPASGGIEEVRVRVIARDTYFQNSADGDDGSFSILAGDVPGPGDLDGDGDVDLADHAAFVGCLSGPDVPAAPGCELADLDPDGDADLADWAEWQAVFGTAP